jgi:hypothetical protein
MPAISTASKLFMALPQCLFRLLSCFLQQLGLLQGIFQGRTRRQFAAQHIDEGCLKMANLVANPPSPKHPRHPRAVPQGPPVVRGGIF